MADVHSKETRSYNMSRVRGKDTAPELLVRKFLHRNGFRYSLHSTALAGKPDIVLPKYKAVVFVHGCFWHGHQDCRYATIPKTKTEWWRAKIEGNAANDARAEQILKAAGWSVYQVWTCDLKKDKMEKTLAKLLSQLNKLRVKLLAV